MAGKIVKIAKGTFTESAIHNIDYYSSKSISFSADGQILEKTADGIVFGKALKREGIERVTFVETKIYLQNTSNFKTPFLDSKELFDLESSKPFIAGLRMIFGCDIKHTAAKKLKTDLENGSLPIPKWKFEKFLSDDTAGFHINGTIHLNEKLILKAEKNPVSNWLLFKVMTEEIGHYIDYLLRNKYDDIGGDTKGDEGTLFAADFIRYNKLLSKNFEFATFKIKSKNGDIRTFTAKVNVNNPDREQKAKELLFIEDDNDDHGIVTLNSGNKVLVEFFKIRGQGAIHENITKQAAKRVGIKYDYRLDEGSAWPDVPCKNPNLIETCYSKTFIDEHKKGTIAYRSHHGDLQFWHSMAPTGDFTNQQVVDIIVKQAKDWYRKALIVKKVYHDSEEKNYYGLFYIGKLLHMVQDSYSPAHIVRDRNNNIQKIQSYNGQDPYKHGVVDAIDQTTLKWYQKYPKKDGISMIDATNEQINDLKGTKGAFEASAFILYLFKMNHEDEILEKYLRGTVYKFSKEKKYASDKAGGTEEAFAKE